MRQVEIAQALIEDQSQQIAVLDRQQNQSVQICIDDQQVLVAPVHGVRQPRFMDFEVCEQECNLSRFLLVFIHQTHTLLPNFAEVRGFKPLLGRRTSIPAVSHKATTAPARRPPFLHRTSGRSTDRCRAVN